MKKSQLNPRLFWAPVFLSLLLTGCVSIQSSPAARFYMLQAVTQDQAIKKVHVASEITIGIEPVRIPEYLNRPQIVTRDKEKLLKFAQFDRWGESLDIAAARLLREDLSVIIPQARLVMSPLDPAWSVKYLVSVEIIQWESELDQDMFLAVQWMIVDARTAKAMLIKRSEFRRSVMPQDYAGLNRTLSTVFASLSLEIAEAVSLLDARSEVNNDDQASKE